IPGLPARPCFRGARDASGTYRNLALDPTRHRQRPFLRRQHDGRRGCGDRRSTPRPLQPPAAEHVAAADAAAPHAGWDAWGLDFGTLTVGRGVLNRYDTPD